MNTRTIRKAIAETFPSLYNFWTWRKLIDDFVNVELTALTIRWSLYQRRRQVDPTATQPELSPVVQNAVVMLAKQQQLPYRLLAISHYVHLHQHGALMADNQRLQHELDRAMTLIESYDQLSKRAVTRLENLSDPDPNNRLN